ncbi:MAG: 50S ribosomal protein L25 [Chloroflexota bacterium]
MEQYTVEAAARTALGKKNKALRRAGITPIHVYGHGTEPLTLQAETLPLIHTLEAVGYTTPLTVKVGADEHFVMVDLVQRHPVTERLLHVDFHQISRTEKVQAAIPLHFEGEARGARMEGASVAEDLHEMEVEALPMDLPHALIVDISVLENEDSQILAGEIALPSGVTLITDPEHIVARIVMHQGGEEETPTVAAGDVPTAGGEKREE